MNWEGRYSTSPNASVWGIDYDKMGEDDNYRVYYRIRTPLSDGKANVRYSYYEGAAQDKRSLKDWLANDKAEVRKAAAVIGDLCADKWLADLGLVVPSGVTATPQVQSGSDSSH